MVYLLAGVNFQLFYWFFCLKVGKKKITNGLHLCYFVNQIILFIYLLCSLIGIEEVDGKEGVIIYHCGTAVRQHQQKQQSPGDQSVKEYVTNGGRVLACVAISDTLIDAAARATYACSKINFSGAQYRQDIAHKGITRYIFYFCN